jgi:hypothetical protein
MKEFKMELTGVEKEILEGKKGETLRKVMETVVRFGEAFGARRLVPITHAPHLVTSFGANTIKPYYAIMDELIASGLKTSEKFTVDPRPLDYENVPVSFLEKLLFGFIFGKQKDYEQQLNKLGLKDDEAFSCACYFSEIGNTPARGDVLAWSESSAVVFANSVFAARTNRNSAGIDIMCNIVGKAPEYGLLTDEGRKADWLIELKTSRLPNAQILGSAIGLKVMEDVPYITGLAEILGKELNPEVMDFFKDMGAASASNGAVGLYHVEGLTPEAKDFGRQLLKPGFKTYVIDDQELERIYKTYPVLWKKPTSKPSLCFIGCPHLSLLQIEKWVWKLTEELQKRGLKKAPVPVVLCSAPGVIKKFKEKAPADLKEKGIRLTAICPLMYMNNPLCAKKPIVTNSNKLRTYTAARFFPDEEIVKVIFEGLS